MSIDAELMSIQADIRVSATMLEALVAFEQGRETLAWYCLMLWCEAKDERAALMEQAQALKLTQEPDFII